MQFNPQLGSERLSEKAIGNQSSLSGSGWGGLRQSSQRAQRCIGRGRCTYTGAVFSNCLGLLENGTFKISPKKVGVRALTLPTPKARSKTPPRPLRPLRETLRIRMGKPGWESGYLFEFVLPQGGKAQRVILEDQVRGLDWRVRQAERFDEVLAEVLPKMGTLIGLQTHRYQVLLSCELLRHSASQNGLAGHACR